MKHTILLLIYVLFIGHAYAQVDVAIKAGLNLATVRYVNMDNRKARVGFNAGLALKIPVQDKLFVRPELLYSSKGYGYSATSTNQAGTLRLNYITLPFLGGYALTKNWNLFAGPEFGFLRKAVSKSQGISGDLTNVYRKFDIGFDLGAAYELNNLFGVEARYNYGFKDLVNVVYLDNTGNVTGQGKDGANSVLQIGLYYWINR